MLVVLIGSSCQKDVNLEVIQLVERTAMPQPTAAGTSFVYGDNIYLFGGRDNFGTNHNDLWVYNTKKRYERGKQNDKDNSNQKL